MYEIKTIANENKGLFFNGLFCGIYSELANLRQFSGNANQIFDVDICVNYFKSLKPNSVVYSYIKNVGNQNYLEVGFNKPVISEGTITEH